MDFVAALRSTSDQLLASARAARVDASVPSCPGWDVHQLVLHAGTTHRWATTLVSTRATGFVVPDAGVVPHERDAILGWFADGAAALTELLDHTDPDAPVWSWGADQHARFWARRMAHETAVHGWDAGGAAGRPPVIPADLAVDGIDEALDAVPAMVAFRPELASLKGNGETIHLHATDTEGEWLVRLTPDGIESSREHAKGDVAARGPASDLYLFLVGRVPPAGLEVLGDSTLLERWQREFRF